MSCSQKKVRIIPEYAMIALREIFGEWRILTYESRL